MKRFQKSFYLLICAAILGTGCVSDKDMAEKIKKAMKEDPSILVEAIKANPVEFFETLSSVAQSARGEMRKRQVEKELEDGINNPKTPKIRSDESIRGTKGAPLVLVEYSDFECPFCTRGYQTVRDLLEKYEGKIQFVYKHLPLSFHPNAMIASQYYEAIRLQNEKKAFDFHDEIFKNQSKLRKGESFLKKIAQDLKVNMSQLAKDIKSSEVNKRIKDDMTEAAELGFQGTPGFLINGVPVKGALPADHFDMIISKLKELGKVSL